MAKAPVLERPYESLFIAPVETPQKTLEAFMEKIKSLITAENGTVRSVQVWGRRRLTYPIKRHKEGMYIYVDFNANNKVSQQLTALYRVTDFIVRHLTVLREDAPVLPVSATEKPADEAQVAAVATEVVKESPSV